MRESEHLHTLSQTADLGNRAGRLYPLTRNADQRILIALSRDR